MGRTIVVISDLHIGGAAPSAGRPRGFRICTQVDALAAFVEKLPQLTGDREIELVINGDFVDFLAEEHEGEFVPFISDEDAAARTFDRIARDNCAFFGALGAHLAAGRRLTILAGNHDVELAYRAVQDCLRAAFGTSGGRVELRLDGRPLRLANAVIEHGHAYDGWNAVFPEQLQSLIATGDARGAPPGSHLVASVMNPLKKSFAFVDLLKPEEETVIPVLLTLDRSILLKVGRILSLMRRAKKRQAAIDSSAMETVSAVGGNDADVDPIDAVRESLERTLGADGAAELWPALVAADAEPVPVTARSGDETMSLLALLLGSPAQQRHLYRALSVVQRDLAFERTEEHDERYVTAAQAYPREVEYVIMGHTHLAKEHRDISPGRAYLNSGTWADLIPFPDVFGADPSEGEKRCSEFVATLDAASKKPELLDDWIAFRPTYVRLECIGDSVQRASLETFAERAREPKPRE